MMDPNNLQAFQYNKQIHCELDDICQPLFRFSGHQLKNFSYHRFYANGSHLSICNRLDWMEFYLFSAPDDGNVFPIAIRQAPLNSINFFLWPNHQDDPILQALHGFNMWNGMSVYRRSQEFVEIWSFSSTPEHEQIKNFYVNNLEGIKFFLSSFNYKAKKFIEPGENIQLAKFKNHVDISFAQENDSVIQDLKCTFEMEMSAKKLLIRTPEGKTINLTKREFECLNQLSKGSTCKEVARTLSIQPRTAEYYINTIKRKFGVHTKSSLIMCYQNAMT